MPFCLQNTLARVRTRPSARDDRVACAQNVLLEFMDKIKGLNSQMCSCRGPLSEYRTILIKLEDLKGYVELVRFIEPSPLASAQMNIIYYMKTLLLILYYMIFQHTFHILHYFI